MLQSLLAHTGRSAIPGILTIRQRTRVMPREVSHV